MSFTSTHVHHNPTRTTTTASTALDSLATWRARLRVRAEPAPCAPTDAPYRRVASARRSEQTPYATSPQAAQTRAAAHSRSARPPCIEVMSSTPSPRSAPYHSPNTAPASAAGAASLSPSAVDGQDAGSCTDQSRRNRPAPRAVATSCVAGGAAPRPTDVETNTGKNTASAATATGPSTAPEHDQQARRDGHPRCRVGDGREAHHEAPQRGDRDGDERGEEGNAAPDDEAPCGRRQGGGRSPPIGVAAVTEDRADRFGGGDDHAVRPPLSTAPRPERQEQQDTDRRGGDRLDRRPLAPSRRAAHENLRRSKSAIPSRRAATSMDAEAKWCVGPP